MCESMIMMTAYSLRHISGCWRSLKLIPLILGLFWALETTGLESSNWNTSLSSRKPTGGYDPVESYYQLRRHYLTSTSRGDGSLSSIRTATNSKNSNNKNSQNSRNFKSPSQTGGGGIPGYDSYHPRHQSQHLNTQNHQHHHDAKGDESGVYGRTTSISGGSGGGSYNNKNNMNHPQDPYSDSNSNNNNNNNNNNNKDNHHRCYVCLPPNKSSREAKDILGMFSLEDQVKLADCAQFGQHNSNQYDFPCPPTHGGCILRTHGGNISRACSRYRLNDCKRANAVEFCYCTQPLCNDIKQEPTRLYHQQRGGRDKVEAESDDEDESSTSSSGDGRDDDEVTRDSDDNDTAEPPSDSGVLHQYTTTTLDSSLPLAKSEGQDGQDEMGISNHGSRASYLILLYPLIFGLLLFPSRLFFS